MSVVGEHTLTVHLTLHAPAGTARDIDAARIELARRVSHVIPFAPLRLSTGGVVRVVHARIESPGLSKPIELSPTTLVQEGGDA